MVTSFWKLTNAEYMRWWFNEQGPTRGMIWDIHNIWCVLYELREDGWWKIGTEDSMPVARAFLLEDLRVWLI